MRRQCFAAGAAGAGTALGLPRAGEDVTKTRGHGAATAFIHRAGQDGAPCLACGLDSLLLSLHNG
ncbi:hypothetical protein [Paragemmobacter straminiformis]|uniref:Uncharacterized protein n=1 Tax=Paragemmobacter straminiformis TaxID=2045119 RepID=A0A842I0E1_9RHOB|nr:hypothetical protein [Gemmobacter straminiformis]MBC2834092.1 hypothetical protein [Gemmobacter straminiformis]